MKNQLDYWRSVWQQKVYLYPFIANDRNMDSKKVLNLLSKYVQFSSSALSEGITGSGNFFRFFSGRWRTQHASQVESAIACYFEKNAYFYQVISPVDYHPVDVILSRVKRQIGDNPINPNGTLAAILKVIQEETGVDFNALNIEEIIGDHSNLGTNHLSPVLTNSECERQRDGSLTPS
jgi:hypothetical protein